jgi:hypothetical protein
LTKCLPYRQPSTKCCNRLARLVLGALYAGLLVSSTALPTWSTNSFSVTYTNTGNSVSSASTWSWQQLGGGTPEPSSLQAYDASGPRLAVDPSTGDIWVAWSQYTGSTFITYVSYLSGGAWSYPTAGVPLANSSSEPAHNPSLVINPSTDTLYVAWAEEDATGNWDINVWSCALPACTSWTKTQAAKGVAPLSTSYGEPSGQYWPRPELADISGTIYVAYAAGGSPDHVVVESLSGSTWSQVGGTIVGGGCSSNCYEWDPYITSGPGGAPFIAWVQYAGSSGSANIYAAYLSGSSWVLAGEPDYCWYGGGLTGSKCPGGTTAVDNERPLIQMVGSTLYLAERELYSGNGNGGGSCYQIYVLAYGGGTSWSEMGSGGSPIDGTCANVSYATSIDGVAEYNDSDPWIASVGNALWVSYSEKSSTNQTFGAWVKTWNGSSWSAVTGAAPLASASGGLFDVVLASASTGQYSAFVYASSNTFTLEVYQW